jgi:flagellar biosynthesis/type III secretory pathway protein FliH
LSSAGRNLLKQSLYHVGGPCLVSGYTQLPSLLHAGDDSFNAGVETGTIPGAADEQALVMATAAETLQSAERRAAEIIAHAEAEAAGIAQRAALDAREQALAELQDELQQQREQAAAQAAEIIAGARAKSELALASTEREAIALALEIARRVVARELEVSPDVVLAVAGEALGRLPDGVSGASLRVSSADLERVTADRERLKGLCGDLRELEVSPHPHVSRGGCIVETSAGDVDGRIETRFSKLAGVLLPDAGDEVSGQ